MGVPIIYRGVPDTIISSNYSDVATGRSVVRLYGMSVLSGASYILTNLTTYSDAIATQVDQTQNTYTKALDLDFDIDITRPFTIEGEAYVSYCIGVSLEGGTSSQDKFMYGVTTLYDYDGTTETQIATATSRIHQTAANNFGQRFTNNLSISKTALRKGHTLRLTFQLYAKAGADNAMRYTLGHDPANRNFTDNTEFPDANDTVFEVLLPIVQE